MGREYSHKRSSGARSRAPNQFLVVVITFFLGYLTATLCDIETISRWLDEQILAHNETNKALPKSQSSQQAKLPPKPKFEFYTLLTKEKISPNAQASANAVVHQAAATSSVAATSSAAATSGIATASKEQQSVAVKALAAIPVSRGTTYSVQVASFKVRQDAEHMKGSLILKGFNVSVVPISHASRGSWFRVVVGPYATRSSAQNAQMDLAKNEHLRGMLVAG